MKTIWRQRWFAIPAILLAVGSAVFFFVEGPRTYEASTAYALADPQVPTNAEIEADPKLLELNSDNPYLRSSDPNLIANVVITRLNARETEDTLMDEGIETEHLVSSGALGGGLVVSITASGETPAASLRATAALGDLLDDYLYEVQKVNGAEDRFLFTTIQVSAAGEPTEKLSSRLRNVIIVGIAGVVLVFGAVSLGTWVESSRSKRRAKKQAAESEKHAEAGADEDAGAEDRGIADDDPADNRPADAEDQAVAAATAEEQPIGPPADRRPKKARTRPSRQKVGV